MPVPQNTESDIAAMRIAGRLASEVLDYITPYVQPGVTTERLDELCHRYIVDIQNAIPAPLGYCPEGHNSPYPKSICTSVNYQICHGIPGPRELKEGDILNIDITVIKSGYHGDTSRMFLIGDTSVLAKRLSQISYECLWYGILAVKPTATLGDIGYAIQRHAERNQFSVVREYCGHGVGKKFHTEPQVLHYGRKGEGMALRPGMIFTIEPMINAGRRDSRVLPDQWTVVTKDRSLSAQWEHTILVTEDGFEVLTLSAGSPAAPTLIDAA